MKKDCVLDKDDRTVSLAEYNYKHGTEYTLDDVYGKGYTNSLTEEEKTDITTEAGKYGVLEIQENIPETPFTEAAKSLGKALLSGDFSAFESLLDDNSEHISYKKETILGKSQVVEYWKGWRARYVETKEAKIFKVTYSNYYSNACLLVDMMVVMFLIRNNKIQKILLIRHRLNPMIGHHDDILEFPYALESIKHCLLKLSDIHELSEPVVTENRIPCMSCNTPSENLEWYSSLFQFGDIGYEGIVSICPHCHKVVEYYPQARIRYNEPVNRKKAKFPVHHGNKKAQYEPKLYGIRNFEGSNPLKGTKYVEGLSGNMKKAAEESNWFLLSTMNSQDFNIVKSCYLKAIDDGVYEAANILGVFAYNFDQKYDEGKQFLHLAIDGGSHNAMLNLFTILWSEGKYEEAINLLTEIYEKPSPSLKCLWNLAFFHFIGEDLAHNPIKKKSKETAKVILRLILEKEGGVFHKEENGIFVTAKKFMKYIDEGNIFSAKAKDYHWRIKTNLDSLKKKGDDAVFYDLDALSLEKGYHICVRIAEQRGIGDESNFYVYDRNDKEDKDFLKYIHVDETSMGVWQIYLIMTSPTMFPTHWHGGYIVRRFILQEKDLYEIEALDRYDLSDLTRQEILYPSVSIKRNAGFITAHVSCCYWNEWKGLVREQVEIKLHSGRVLEYNNVGEFIIFKYNCGIFF